MNKKKVLDYFQNQALEDLDTAKKLINAKKYHHGLFFAHLAIEKLIKGLVYKNINKHPLPIHNLKKLAKQAKLNINEKQSKQLKEITSWNIEARYDNIKRQFYKKATKDFTLNWFKIVKELYQWLEKQY
jgi:HEPN domain-containing protein